MLLLSWRYSKGSEVEIGEARCVGKKEISCHSGKITSSGKLSLNTNFCV